MGEEQAVEAGVVGPAGDIDFFDVGRALAHKSDAELRAAFIVFSAVVHPWLYVVSTTLARVGLALRLPPAVWALRRTVFVQFCGGSTIEEALRTAACLREHKIGTILDYAVESEKTAAGFAATSRELGVALAHAAEGGISFCALKVTGMAPSAQLIKATAGVSLQRDEQTQLDAAWDRVAAVAASAAACGVAIFADAEESWVQGCIDAWAERLMERHNRGRPIVHTTVQLYLRRGLAYLHTLIARARERGYVLGVKLVRGAYLDQENERARRLGCDSPIHPSKMATDAAFDAAITVCLENLDAVAVCVATHNVGSIGHLLAQMRRLGIARDHPRVTVSQLLGMFDRITYPLAEHGYRTLKYVPYGQLRAMLPYLLRRAQENKMVAQQAHGELAAVRAEMRRRGLSIC